MNFDPLLLDAFAMVFVDAAIRELEMQAQLARLRPAQPCAGCAHFVQGGVLRKPPITPYFESLIIVSDPDVSTPRPPVRRAHYR